eukprot:TRINITY_DN5348_c0_g1_i4.p1 TRINITY_DN5348_c0_g1~~TRINITY_DN5348_c0_g1_i4.p1  ORF type:complete len:216 (-),score=-11.40 TRINITY_DN5348_c0_g1_i4:180-827(-)
MLDVNDIKLDVQFQITCIRLQILQHQLHEKDNLSLILQYSIQFCCQFSYLFQFINYLLFQKYKKIYKLNNRYMVQFVQQHNQNLFQFINYLLFQKYEKIQIYLNNRYMVQFVKNLFYNNQSFNKQYIKQTKNLQNKFKFFSNFQVFRSYSHFFKTFGERRSWFDVVVNIVPTRLYIYVSYIQMTGLQIFDFLGRQILILVQQIIIICNMHLKHVC